MSKTMDFGDALRALKQGKKVTRAGWNGRGMYLFIARPIAFGLLGDCTPEATVTTTEPSICMRTAQSTIVVGWLASQTDMLAEDWEVLL